MCDQDYALILAGLVIVTRGQTLTPYAGQDPSMPPCIRHDWCLLDFGHVGDCVEEVFTPPLCPRDVVDWPCECHPDGGDW